MSKNKALKFTGIGLLLIVLIALHFKFIWETRGYLAFGGEGLLYGAAIAYYIYTLVEEIRHE